MVTFKATAEQIGEWFPKSMESFIKELKESESTSRKHPLAKIQWFVTWGFMVKKAKTPEEKVLAQNAYNEKLKLPYNERLEVELPRIKVDIAFKAGHYFRSDRVLGEETPKYINDMAKEIVKSMIYQEQKTLNDPNVLDSIQDFIDKIQEEESQEILREAGIDLRPKREPSFDLDLILDKINETGISSLTASELNFLEKRSKGE